MVWEKGSLELNYLTSRLFSDNLCECPGEKTGADVEVGNYKMVNTILAVVPEEIFPL